MHGPIANGVLINYVIKYIWKIRNNKSYHNEFRILKLCSLYGKLKVILGNAGVPFWTPVGPQVANSHKNEAVLFTKLSNFGCQLQIPIDSRCWLTRRHQGVFQIYLIFFKIILYRLLLLNALLPFCGWTRRRRG